MYQAVPNPSSSPQNKFMSQNTFNIDEHPILGQYSENMVPNQENYKEGLSSRSFHNDENKSSNPEYRSPSPEKEVHATNTGLNTRQNLLKLPSHDLDSLNSFIQIKMLDKSATHSSEIIQSEDLRDEIRPTIIKKSRSDSLSKKREEIKRKSVELGTLKDSTNIDLKANKEETSTSSMSDIVISKKRGADDAKKSNFVARSLLPSKPVTISLPFDAFVDQVKGNEQASIASTYPSYKIDKRLIFLGKEVDYPWHVISYHSTFRRLWNVFIILVIVYQVFWYPAAVSFNYERSWPIGTLIVEIVSIVIFLLDIIINIRTTYSNENNEEIIDGKMMRNNYFSTKLFKIDVITTLPVPEILLIVLIGSDHQWTVYSLVILLRMLRCLKISTYLQNRTLSVLFKLLKVFITFFIIVHWVSCLWYIVLKIEFPEVPTLQNLWFPNNLRMISTGDQDLMDFYYGMDTVKVYGFTLLSVFMLVVGSDMAPITDFQIWVSVFVGLFGAVSLAYIFGLVTLTINRANEESLLYQQQLEELKNKLRVNKIPHNLRVKVMEYFYYSWRKNNVLKKMDDFSELSLPLQRDIALYQHQEMILKVPLFKDLDPVEILRIVQKLRTSIYMPGDRIIREGERGNEMFFIQEGIAEMMIKKAALKGENTNTKPKYERVFLEKGNYFGEVALMSNSKRTFDVNAFEFCILYSFSKSDYESLKSEFKDIGPRLRSGLKHYKNTHMDQLIQILKNLDIFQNFTDQELRKIGAEYLEEVFVDPDKVVLAPKDRINAIYVIFAGNVKCFSNDEETRNYVHYLRRSDDKNNWTIVDMDEEEEIDCLDDDILNLEKDKLSMDDQKNRLNLIRTYTYGEYFGTLDFDVNEIKCNKYYLTDSGCQIGAITQSLKSQMAIEDPELYEKFRNNVIRWCPRRVMMPIEEEDDSSFTTRNNTIVKLKANRRQSISSDDGKRPVLIRASNANKEEDMGVIKGDLQQLEEEMSHFRTLISGLNARLSNMALNSQDIILGEPSPSKLKPRSLIFGQTGNTVKIPRKTFSEKEMPRILMGVDEVDQIEESQSIRKEEVWPLN